MSTDRDEALALLLGSCPSFAAGAGLAGYLSSFEEPGDTGVSRVGAGCPHVVPVQSLLSANPVRGD